eukprot:TRINITY_DN80522_c0_g1_i1.p1 TRINITY_DN80522_c0_g1~~TRINITY_DN80522_c0_g1_i1.p1  ORF type:complete len:488 (+),score=121.29 TRINITY_DN80522_c0_g1_i1:23-1465(+)
MPVAGDAGGDGLPNLRVVMGAALDAYLLTERHRAEEASEFSLELKKLRSKVHDSYTTTQQRIGEEVTQVTSELKQLREEVTSMREQLREELARESALLSQGTAKLALELEGEVSRIQTELSEVSTIRTELSTIQTELGTIRTELGEVPAQMREEAAGENTRLRSEVVNAARDAYNASEQRRVEEVSRLSAVIDALKEEMKEEDKKIRDDVFVSATEAYQALEQRRNEAMAQLSLQLGQVQDELRTEFKAADASLHGEIATSAANDRYAMNLEIEKVGSEVGPLRQMIVQAQNNGAHEVMATLRVDSLFSQSLQPLDYEFPLVASRCMIRLKPVRKVEVGGVRALSPSREATPSRGPGRSVTWEAGLEYVGMFFGLCETRVALGNAANRLSSYTCSVRIDVFDPVSATWLTALENPIQELNAGGSLFGSNEVFTVHRFKELVSSGLSPDRKLTVRVVVSDVGLLRLQQFEDTQPTMYGGLR